MKTWFILWVMLCQLALGSHAQLIDGPYVFEKGDSTYVVSVVDGMAVFKRFLRNKLGNQHIQVSFADTPQWNFEVALRGTGDADKRRGLKVPDEPSEFAQPKKMLVLSDIEGEFSAFRSILIAGGVIDEKYNWTFGRGHLIICGDLFDRGKNVVEGLWLLYHLEHLAIPKGGMVHIVLGNHDIMNMSGDLRYVDKKYLESARLMGMDYKQIYSSSSILGRWLRGKNVVEKIGDRLFLHAGISPEVLGTGLSVEQINARCRPYYDVPPKQVPEDVKLLFGAASPFWYRGYFMKPLASMAHVDSTLAFYGVRQIVVGHTILPENIASYNGGKVIGIDVDYHKGDHRGLLLEGNKWWVVDDLGNKSALK